MPRGSEFCAECGAPLEDAPGIGGSDQEVYPELAKANLLRMRKEYKPAEDICLSILRRYPNNASANTLLGDICTERGDLEQAAEWYELALDILPDSQTDKEKLAAVRTRLAEKDKAVAVETLGITHTSKPPYVAIVAIILAVCIVGMGVAFAMQGNKEPIVNKDGSNKVVINDPKPQANVTPIVPEKDGPQIFFKDPELAAKIAEQLNLEPDRLMYVEVGEDDKAVILHYRLPADDDWVMRAKLIRSAFANSPDAPTATVSAMRDFKVVDTNFVPREKYDTAMSLSWQEETGATDEALVELFFGQKLEPKATETPTQPDPNQQGTPPIGEGGQSPPPNTGTEPPADDKGGTESGQDPGIGG